MSSSLSNYTIKSIKYISLKKDLIRRVLLRTQLWLLPCKKKWIHGVVYDAKNPVHKEYIKKGCLPYLKEKMHHHRQKGVVGCWMAHTHALEDIKDRDGISIILEDDFVCKPGFFKKAIKMLQGFDREFDIIVFDPSGSGPLPEHRIRNNIYTNNGGTYPLYWGSHCLFINNRSVPKILDVKRYSQICDYDGFLMTNTELKIYLFYSHMSTVINFGSNIFAGNPKKKYLIGILNWIQHRFFMTEYVRPIQ